MNDKEPTLLSHLNEVREQHIIEGGLTTVVYCGSLSHGMDTLKALDIHKQIVGAESVLISGILLGQGNSILHLLEGPSDNIIKILQNLAKHESFCESNFQSGRVVYCVEDRPQRIFPEWFSCTMKDKTSNIDNVTDENVVDVIHNLATGLLEIGKGLQDLQNDEEINLEYRYAEYLPARNFILALSSSSLFFTLEEFVDMYAGPYHLHLDSEQSWPLERLVQF